MALLVGERISGAQRQPERAGVGGVLCDPLVAGGAETHALRRVEVALAAVRPPFQLVNLGGVGHAVDRGDTFATADTVPGEHLVAYPGPVGEFVDGAL